MSLSSETVDTLTEDNNTAAEERGQGQSNQGQKEEGEEEVQQRFSYEVDPDIGVIVWRGWQKCSKPNQNIGEVKNIKTSPPNWDKMIGPHQKLGILVEGEFIQCE